MRTLADASEISDSDEEEWASRSRVDRPQSQLSELRKFVNSMVKQHAKDLDNLKVIARLSQRTVGTLRDEIHDTKLEVAQSLSLQDQRLSEVENGYRTMNEWAAQEAEKADPDALWADLAEKEARVSELETNMKELQSSLGPGARAGPDAAEEIGVEARMTE